MKCIAKKSLLLMALMLLSGCQAQPKREQRQLKSPATGTEADVKMMTANMTPASPSMGMNMNQMGMQLARYPGYPGLVFGGGAAPAASYLGGNSYSGYPSDPSLGLGYGLGLGAYPGQPQSNSGFMYGNPMYGNPQLGNGNGFGVQPGVDNFAALNNIINMANVQGLAAGPSAGLYPQAGIGAGFGDFLELVLEASQEFLELACLFPATLVAMELELELMAAIRSSSA
ncbi:uncharacterized protein LOC117785807 [Drosophila innubila]|uniref:uncharacterized protein LOC117785807 n=1 Tax=Drosophila innubila TaxID=198719 RepID=UPI00148BE018|nr:uncharacterized protein LOC117785807 [Drosophila innubila]